jgi:hypothetical protein
MNKTLLTFGLLGFLAAGSAIAVSSFHNSQTSTNASNTMADSHAEQSMPGMNDSEMPTEQHGSQNEHSGHSGSAATAKASLAKPWIISHNKSTPLTIAVTNLRGKAIAQFDTFQEKLMHLIVVSDDLQFFDHIHPVYKGNGRFDVSAKFPQPGAYTLFSDYKPTGQVEQVSVLKVQSPGTPPTANAIDYATVKYLDTIKVNPMIVPALKADTIKVSLAIAPTTLKAGQEAELQFTLQQPNGATVTDLQPYLGEKGHLVILKRSAPLTRADYIHAHALKDGPTAQVKFMTTFPQPGQYKLWGQFQRNGQIVVSDFWVNVL